MSKLILKGETELDALVDAVARAPRATALFCDIDGTIAPIVADPYAAAVPPRMRVVLAALAVRLGLLAFVTGRDLAQGQTMVAVDGAAYVGTHGLEVMEPGGEARCTSAAEPYIEAVHEFAGRGAALAAIWPGIVTEDKRTVVSVHYRSTADPAAARAAIEKQIAAPAREAGLAISTGHFVVEVRPPLATSKGTAVTGLLETRELKTVIFCGDDLTDVTGFNAVHEWATLDMGGGTAADAPGQPSAPDAGRQSAPDAGQPEAPVRRRAGYAVAALTAETPPAVKEASEIQVAATPGMYEVFARLLAAIKS